jgi:hypothetical protein
VLPTGEVGSTVGALLQNSVYTVKVLLKMGGNYRPKHVEQA